MKKFYELLRKNLKPDYKILRTEDYKNLYRGICENPKGKTFYFAVEKFTPYGLEYLAKELSERLEFNESNS